MISFADVLLLNEMLQELHSNDIGKIRKKLLIDLYGVKYTIRHIRQIEHFKDLNGDNHSSVSIATAEVAIYNSRDEIIREYSIPLSVSKCNNVVRAVKSAHASWRKTIETRG